MSSRKSIGLEGWPQSRSTSLLRGMRWALLLSLIPVFWLIDMVYFGESWLGIQTQPMSLLPWLLGSLAIVLAGLALALAREARLRAGILRDTERERQRLREMQRVSGMGYWEYHPDEDRLIWSDELLQMVGIKRDAFGNHIEDFYRFLHPDDRERVDRVHQESIRTQQRAELRFRVVQHDGSIRHIDESSEVRQLSGQRVVVTGVSRDVTVLVQAGEQALRQAEQYRFLFAHNPMPMAVYDRQTQGILAVNEASLTLFGYDEASLLTMTAEQMLAEGERIRFAQHLASVPPGHVDAGVFGMLCLDGRVLQCHIYAQTIRFHGHDARMVLVVDVTVAQQARQALERHERMYRELLLQLPAPLLLCAEDKIRFANTAAAVLLGSSNVAQLIGQKVERFIEVSALATCHELREENRFTLNSRIRRLDGEDSDGEISVARYRTADLDGFQMLLQDLGAERKLQAEQIEREAFFRLSADGFCILDTELRMIQVNAALGRLLGVGSLEVLEGQLFYNLFEDQNATRLRALIERLEVGTVVTAFECYIKGSAYKVWVNLGFTRPYAETCYVVVRDITRQHRAETEARLLQRAVEAANNGIVLMKAGTGDLPLVYVNPAFTQVTGYQAQEVLGHNLRFLSRDDQDQPGLDILRRGYSEQRSAGAECRNYRKDGTLFWNRVYISPVWDTEGNLTHWVGVQQDITEERAREEQLNRQAHTDDLTGLPNRREMLRHMRERLPDESLALVQMDIDQFKLINDAFGHAAGDEVLQLLAKRLRENLADEVTLARFGGDEFLILVARADHTLEQVVKIARATIRQPIELQNMPQHLTPSLGVALAPEHGRDAETLLRNADAAMYEAKKQGRNQVVYYNEGLRGAAYSRLQVNSRLRGVDLSKELALHYQTVHAGRDGHIVGAEILLRWPIGPSDLRQPAVLVPLLEETGLILPVGRWVLAEACKTHARLQRLAPGCRVAVNVSAQQLRHADLVLDLSAALAGSGVDPALLDLELTESALLVDPHKAEIVLNQIKELGVSIVIDDFGTGYSSLAYLHRLPVDKLKIDQSFVRDLLDDPDDAMICSSIITLANNLGLGLVAEGVETEGQRDWLLAHGCEVMQGYLFARPRPVEDLP